jgi:SAM-dependent MidA family methyltransferase
MKNIAEIIRGEIAAVGVLPFARFMRLALYHPHLGYYETQKTIGRSGDFYTSVSVGSLFGQLLAFQFSGWLEEFSIAGCRLRIVEAGAHDGSLAKDILNWLQIHRPKLFERIEYVIIEPSPCRLAWQKETLAAFENKIQWVGQISELHPQSAICNPQFFQIIFSNELLDAFPVHRLGWDAKGEKWFEWGVALDGEKFVWARIQNPESRIRNPELPDKLLQILPDNFIVEISSAAENWWREAANVLNRGKLLTIDYGLTNDELFLPQRKGGTLRAFCRHHFADDLLANPGEQDLTAHVNFSSIQKAGEDAGLKTEIFSTQSKFLTDILGKTLKDKNFGEWTSARTRQFQTLTHPEHLGRAFQVLVQSR